MHSLVDSPLPFHCLFIYKELCLFAHGHSKGSKVLDDTEMSEFLGCLDLSQILGKRQKENTFIFIFTLGQSPEPWEASTWQVELTPKQTLKEVWQGLRWGENEKAKIVDMLSPSLVKS